MITDKEIQHLAGLSRLRYDDKDSAEMKDHLEHMLVHLARLDSVDTSTVEATAHVLSAVNVLREDVAVSSTISRQQMLSNATKASEDGYIVPKVIE